MWRGIFTVMRFSATNGVSRWLFSIRMMTLKSRVEMKPSRSWSRSLNACRACSSCMSCHTQYNTPSCFIAFEVTTHFSTYSSTICYVRIRVGWTLSRSRDVVGLVRNRGVRSRCWSQTRIRNGQSFASVSIRTPLQSNAWRHKKTMNDHSQTSKQCTKWYVATAVCVKELKGESEDCIRHTQETFERLELAEGNQTETYEIQHGLHNETKRQSRMYDQARTYLQ